MTDPQDNPGGGSELLIYRSDDGKSHIQVRLEDKTVWLPQGLMAELFQTTPRLSAHPGDIRPGRRLRRGAAGVAALLRDDAEQDALRGRWHDGGRDRTAQGRCPQGQHGRDITKTDKKVEEGGSVAEPQDARYGRMRP